MSDKQFKIDTTSEIGHIYINNQDGEHMSWIEVENTLNEQQAEIDYLKDMITAMKLDIKNAMQMVSRWNDERETILFGK